MAFVKDPDATLDYLFDWNPWLDTSETISSFTVTVPAGLTLTSSTQTGGVVTAWISGGTDETDYTVACRITTSGGRIDERSIPIRVRNR